jgi:S-(hydroxymethyl)glutathione dehydrogenase/alcohol dehydrogenase
VATGFGAVTRHAKVPAGADVLVIGAGGVGLNIIQAAKVAGARHIIAADLLDNKLGYAKQFGATHTINAKSENVVKSIKALTKGAGVDFAFDAIGSDITATQIVDAVGPGGHAVMVGIPAATAKAPVSPFQMVFMEKQLTGSFYGSVQPSLDFPILCDLYMEKKLNLDDLISRTYRFDEINEGFNQLRTGGVARGVVMFD